MPQSDTAIFLTALIGDYTTTSAYGCYHWDGRNNEKKPYAVYNDSLINIEDQLDILNADGYNVYYYFNEMDGFGIKRQNVVGVRGFFVDFDDILAPTSPALPESFHIGRDNNAERSQMIWLISDECPLHIWETLMYQLAEKFGGDKKVCRLETAARLVGYAAGNPAYDADYVTYSHNEVSYTTEEFIAAFDLDPDLPLPKQVEAVIPADDTEKVKMGERNAALCTLASRLRMYHGGPKGIKAFLQEFRDNNMEVGDDPISDGEIEHVTKWAMTFSPEHQVNVAELIQFEKLVANPDLPTFNQVDDKTINKKPPFPKEILGQVQGTMRMVMDYINDNSHRLQPNLAFGGALVAMAGLCAKSIQSGRTSASIIVVGTAPTGHGKNSALENCQSLFLKVDHAQDILGPNDFSSDVAFLTMVEEHKNVVCYIDEFGDRMGKAKQLNSHTQNLMSRIKEMYSNTGHGYRFKTNYADSKNNKFISNFNFSIYGTGVPSAIFDSLTTADIRGGLTARLLLIEGEDAMPPSEKNRMETPPPTKLLDDIKHWAGQHPAKPEMIEMTDEAWELTCKYTDEMDVIIRDSSEIVASFFTRCSQNAAKVALILAASRSRTPKIEACDMVIAMEFCRYTAKIGAWHALNSVSDTRVGRDNNLILRTVYQAGKKGMPLKALVKTTRNMLDKKQREASLDELIESGDVIEHVIHNGKPGVNPKVYIATAHLTKENNDG